jgi:thiamine pyrophosphate-dependent acetolactate synthase large subunit-like protein
MPLFFHCWRKGLIPFLGIPGGAIMPIYDALYDHDKKCEAHPYPS